MKKLLLLAAFAAVSFNLFAQKIIVTESKEHIGGGSNNALVVSIYQTSPDVVEKEVKSMLKSYNSKVSSQDDGFFATNAVIKDIAASPINIYAKWDKQDEGETRLMMAFNTGSDFISSASNEDQFKVASDIVRKFALRTTGLGMAAMVKTEQKTFDKLTDDQKKLVKENQSLSDDVVNYNQRIEDYKQKIKKAQDDIESNKSNQSKKKDEISAQQKILDAAKDKQKGVN